MTVLAGPLHAAAVVVAVAAVAKLRRPAPAGVAMRTLGLPGSRWFVRAVAVGEAAVAAAAFAGGRAGAAALAALHLGFAAVAAALRARSASCGCFGEATPVDGTHVVANLVVAAVALGAAADGIVPSLTAALEGTPAAGVPYAVGVAVLAAAEIACLTALPDAHAAARRVLST